jgi:hypothetical protein
MTAYEVISVFIAILALLISFGSLIKRANLSHKNEIVRGKNNASPV